MVAHTSTYLAWQHGQTGLNLVIATRTVPVPAAVSVVVLADGTSDDPATDLLLAEQALRGEATRLGHALAQASGDVTSARAAADEASPGRTWEARRQRRASRVALADAAAAHRSWAQRHEQTLAVINTLREFVVAARVPDGLLAEAATGWQRSPEPPPYVIEFDTEQAFLEVDRRRGTRMWWGGIEPAGIHVGHRWRRDGDDEDPDAKDLLRTGSWRVSYLPATGEIYACLRGAYLPDRVWLLGSGFDPVLDQPTTLLRELEEHMSEPNSLILVAKTVHLAAQAAAGRRLR